MGPWKLGNHKSCIMVGERMSKKAESIAFKAHCITKGKLTAWAFLKGSNVEAANGVHDC